MIDFEYWKTAAITIVGSDEERRRRLPRGLSKKTLRSKPDSYFLSKMCLRVFQSGLQHKMVLQKWPAFERVYFDFDPAKIVLLDDERLDLMMHSEGLIRHWQKTKAIRTNAAMVLAKAEEAGSFGRWLLDWPKTDTVGLWRVLKKEGAHLGGHSASRFLRLAGYDTFLLTDDVIAVLHAHGCIERAPTTIKELDSVQALFNAWADQGDCSLAEVSRTISLLAGVNERY